MLNRVLRSSASRSGRIPKFDNVFSYMLDVLHWLPLQQRITFRIIALVGHCWASLRPIFKISATLHRVFRIVDRNLKVSKGLLKSQAHQGTSLLTSTVTNQRGVFQRGSREAQVREHWAGRARCPLLSLPQISGIVPSQCSFSSVLALGALLSRPSHIERAL